MKAISGFPPPSLILDSPAKINLHLEVGRKQPDGYHDICTLFALLRFGDTLAAGWQSRRPGNHTRAWRFKEGLTFYLNFSPDYPAACRRELMASPGDNLVIRAHRLLLGQFPEIAGRPIWIGLHKRVPAGAGLGGGSSNAAAALMALVLLFKLPVSRKRLLVLGRRLGSDVPFFLTATSRRPLWWGLRRGDKLRAYPGRFRSPLLLIYPGFAVPTRQAYQALDDSGKGLTTKMILPRLNARSIPRRLTNRFEEWVFGGHPVLAQAKRFLVKEGARGVSLSGSGSCIYALASRAQDCRLWARRMKRLPEFQGFHYTLSAITGE